jgi:surfactin synthase thioesterase subunit
MLWGDSVDDLEVWGVQLPGRGNRLHEKPLESMSRLVDMLMEEAVFEAPFAFFGHSLGGLVAFETVRALKNADRKLPVQLFLSACHPPHAPRPDPDIRTLSNAQLVEWLDAKYRALPAELRNEPELLDLLLPATRGDLTIYNEYEYRHAPPVEVPMLVMGGDHDPITPELLQEWRRHSAAEFAMRIFPGDHFYLREQRTEVLCTIDKTLVGSSSPRSAN